MDRKSFFKKLGTGVGAVAVGQAMAATDIDITEDLSLTDAQKNFVKGYKDWLSEFKTYIERRNENFGDMENNKKLMELSSQAQEWRAKLDKHMTDDKYHAYFLDMTKEVTSLIA